jgi:hypothetical protein
MTAAMSETMIDDLSAIPKFTHDCDRCIFLGSTNDADLYVCIGDEEHTFIARLGNDGNDYLASGYEARTPLILQAIYLAKERGLI